MYNEYRDLLDDYKDNLIKELDNWADEVRQNISVLIKDDEYSRKVVFRLFEKIHGDFGFFQPCEYPLLYAILKHVDNLGNVTIRGTASKADWYVLLKLIKEFKYEVNYAPENEEDFDPDIELLEFSYTVQDSVKYGQKVAKDGEEGLNNYLNQCAKTIKLLGIYTIMAHPRIANAVADLLIAPFDGYSPGRDAEYIPVANIVYQYAIRLKATPTNSRLWEGILAAIDILQRKNNERVARE